MNATDSKRYRPPRSYITEEREMERAKKRKIGKEEEKPMRRFVVWNKAMTIEGVKEGTLYKSKKTFGEFKEALNSSFYQGADIEVEEI
jgi:hypothetical protein